MTKSEVLARIQALRIVALLRADDPGGLVECARALAAGGIGAVELTMTTPGAVAMVARLTRELPGLLLGLGTVLEAADALAGIGAGARFIVTPAVRPAVIEACREQGTAILCGALTPTEACAARDAGADVIKIFPAEFFGPAYIKSLKGPFPGMMFLPTGGVTPETIGEFLRAGAFATAAGSSLVSPAALKARDWAAITARARQFVAAANAVEQPAR